MLSQFPFEKLQPESGVISAIVGSQQRLFWKIRIDFKNVEYPDRDLGDVGFVFGIEKSVRCWRDLHLDSVDIREDNPDNQAAFYYINWDNWVNKAVVSIKHESDNFFTVDAETVVDFWGWDTSDRNPNLPISIHLERVPFQTLWVTHQAGVSSIEGAKELLTQLVDLRCYEEPSIRLLKYTLPDFNLNPRI